MLGLAELWDFMNPNKALPMQKDRALSVFSAVQSTAGLRVADFILDCGEMILPCLSRDGTSGPQ